MVRSLLLAVQVRLFILQKGSLFYCEVWFRRLAWATHLALPTAIAWATLEEEKEASCCCYTEGVGVEPCSESPLLLLRVFNCEYFYLVFKSDICELVGICALMFLQERTLGPTVKPNQPHLYSYRCKNTEHKLSPLNFERRPANRATAALNAVIFDRGGTQRIFSESTLDSKVVIRVQTECCAIKSRIAVACGWSGTRRSTVSAEVLAAAKLPLACSVAPRLSYASTYSGLILTACW